MRQFFLLHFVINPLHLVLNVKITTKERQLL